MKTLRATFLALLFGSALSAQDAAPPPAPADAGAAVSSQRTAEELDQLLAPISLYPDALIALILPASTVPADIVLASRHLREQPDDRTQIEHRAWDDSVKSLTNYPEVLNWMDENLQWTKQLGEAFLTQPADVMQAVQRLRARAKAAGALVDTPQQQVIAEAQVIRIVPAQPDIIYVPHYEPQVVFYDPPIWYSRPVVSFGFGVAVGSWLAYDCDWRRNTIWVGNRHRRWTGHDWHRPVVPFTPANAYTRSPDVRPWRPSPQAVRPAFSVNPGTRAAIVQPAPFSVTSARTYSYSRPGPNPSGRRHDNVSNPALPASPRNQRPFAPSVRPESSPVASTFAPDVSPVTPSVAPVAPTIPPATGITVAPAPTPRRRINETARDPDAAPRSRPPRATANPTVTPAPNPVATTPNVIAPPATVVPAPQPPPARTYTRSSPPQAQGPRATPPPAPRSVPSSAPATNSRPSAAPAPAPAEAPAAAPAPSSAPPSRGGDSRGNRPGERRGDPAR